MKNRLLRSRTSLPALTEAERAAPTARLQEEDVVTWRGHVLRIVDVADFHDGGIYVTVAFVGGRPRQQLSLRLSDLESAQLLPSGTIRADCVPG